LKADDRPANGDGVRAASRESLTRLIKQLKEEIIWTEAHRAARRR
jgi:hypothetical protein